jgi:hypothetical protein
MISLLITILVVIVVLYAVNYVIGMLTLPPPVKQIALLIVGIVGLIYILQLALGVLHGGANLNTGL